MEKPFQKSTWIRVSISMILISVGLTACSEDKDKTKPSKFSGSAGVQQSLKDLGCESFRSSFFEKLQDEVLRTQSIPKMEDLNSDLNLEMGQRFETRLTEMQRSNLAAEISHLYEVLLVEVPLQMEIENAVGFKRTLGALAVGDQSSTGAAAIQNQLSVGFKNISKMALEAGISCEALQAQSAFNLSENQRAAANAKIPLPVYGLRKAFATAYQSCESLKQSPMTRRSPDNEGVEDAGPYPGSLTGRFYKIVDQEALARTHYYVRDFKQAPGCVDVKKHTMIYDYGGKPYSTSAADSSLNYWKNNGDGSKGLGIDCSGYVFTSHAAAGLRLVAGARMKANQVEDYPASMYINPSSNGLSCLKKVSMGKSGSLQAGDVIASKYHVAMIERVGADPFAIKKYQDCNEISYRDFDFVIAQSSPDHNEVGINKYDASEYLAPFMKFIFRAGLENYARQACQAYQAGRNVTVDSSAFGISRHKLTPECMQNEIKLDAQSCIESCRELLE